MSLWKTLVSGAGHALPATKYDLQQMERRLMALIDDLTAQVTANTDAEQSAIVLLGKLHDLLVAAGTDPTKLQAIKDTLKTSADALAAAVVANTPAA